MRRFFIPMLCLGLLTASCAGAPMNLSEFYGFCIMGPLTGRDICEDQLVCGVYRANLSREFESLDQCLAVCRETTRRQNMEQAMRGCGGTINRGNSLCNQYCRRKYTPASPQSQTGS